jgi:hypothetical protein
VSRGGAGLIIFVSHVSIASDNIAWGCSVFKMLNDLELPARQFVKQTGESMSDTRVMLDVIDVRTPCPASWDAMAGDERSRFCEHCGLYVHNLSAMTLDEAQRAVCERGQRLCVRFERDGAGRVLTLDYQRPARTPRTWKFWTFIGAAGAIAAALVRLAMWNPARPGTPIVVMGDIATPTTNPAPTPVP